MWESNGHFRITGSQAEILSCMQHGEAVLSLDRRLLWQMAGTAIVSDAAFGLWDAGLIRAEKTADGRLVYSITDRGRGFVVEDGPRRTEPTSALARAASVAEQPRFATKLLQHCLRDMDSDERASATTKVA